MEHLTKNSAPTRRSAALRRWRQALLRRDRIGRANRVRTRVRRRPSLVGNADAPFRPALPLHQDRKSTPELQSPMYLVYRPLLEKKKQLTKNQAVATSQEA